jgi:hypothetical protein
VIMNYDQFSHILTNDSVSISTLMTVTLKQIQQAAYSNSFDMDIHIFRAGRMKRAISLCLEHRFHWICGNSSYCAHIFTSKVRQRYWSWLRMLVIKDPTNNLDFTDNEKVTSRGTPLPSRPC